ncbi:FAD-dependent oxidoreductase [Mycobacterium sp. ITM-2016-00318]|uniref:FAD-dependent oxidoreductase n=1 Tax=Mycobacterium sp. ITM-2016-00318 TaxID=2099693 RepID=UPI001304CE45|nr:FAD-dependent oxidoreductase [Mycobacterium sp. ITM-2016-00318]WNG93016.1 FAD-dependent oxidoreductase [Mycobacterium sp. ITM-2016-00318]
MSALRSRAAPFRMRPRRLVVADPLLPRDVSDPAEVTVVGGGIAGMSAAVVLAERGVKVTVLESAGYLGGRLGAWHETLPCGSEQHVEHGFHAFFRHYYTWRSILRRVDPQLSFLQPVPSYPVISATYPAEDLSGLPAAPPLNLLALALRSKSLTRRELTRANPDAGRALLAYDRATTTAEFDDTDAAAFLDSLGMSERTRSMLFEAFARSFFCNQGDLSAAELVAMFHYYFLGNPEGIGFDVTDTDYATAIWNPLREYLIGRDAELRTETRVTGVEPDGQGWRIGTETGELRSRHVVLALDPGALRTLLAASPTTAAAAPGLARQCQSLTVAPPFAVSRLWLDRDVAPERASFSAVTGQPNLDSVAVYSRLEEPSARWARETGGSVIELHSYSCGLDNADVAAKAMREELAALWPEIADAAVVHRHDRMEATAPAFPPGSAGTRPGVRTDARGLRIAGDFVELPYLSGLMERSAMSGVLAANDILAELGVAAEPVLGVPQRGLLAGVPRIPRRTK